MHAYIHKILFDDAIAWSEYDSTLGMHIQYEETTTLETVRIYPFHYCEVNGKVYKLYADPIDLNTYIVWFSSH